MRTVDTDVVIILLGKFSLLHKINNSYAAIWVALGTGRNFKYLQINAISRSLGEEKSLAMPYFHSFTGCETTSSFFRKGKKITAWEAWKSYPDVTTAFVTFALDPFLDFNRQSQIFGLLQRFTVVLYIKGSTLKHIDELRKEHFCRDNKLMENLPPTTDALFQHARRAAYQASIWTSSHRTQQ